MGKAVRLLSPHLY